MIYKPILPVDTLLNACCCMGRFIRFASVSVTVLPSRLQSRTNQDHQYCGQIAAAILAGGFFMPSNKE